ncbi:DUF4625 domain-containing protein [Saccharicrinis sp. GN24d3]|uniref:DUF4625 domain-containing protein n=1 Tax=Saccharicrinis sp. GN24d3 TaxID=3458416 RepID=UPI0040364FBC
MKIYFPKMISCFAIATALMLSACGGDGGGDEPEPEPTDSANPVITVTTPTATGQTYPLGGTFQFTGTFTDDLDLKEVEFILEDNKPPSAASLKAATGVEDEPWEPEAETVALSGKTGEVNKGLFGGIPASDIWTGSYTLTITCTDAVGKTATKTIDVTLE